VWCVGVADMADYQAMSLLKRLFSFNKEEQGPEYLELILVRASSLLLAWLAGERAWRCYAATIWPAVRVHLALVMDRDTVAPPLASRSHPQILGPHTRLFNLYTCTMYCLAIISMHYYSTTIIRISKISMHDNSYLTLLMI
jgi:hypothetical protein